MGDYFYSLTVERFLYLKGYIISLLGEQNKQTVNSLRTKATGRQLHTFKHKNLQKAFISRWTVKCCCKTVHYLTSHWPIQMKQTKDKKGVRQIFFTFGMQEIMSLLLCCYQMTGKVSSKMQKLNILLILSSHIHWCSNWNCWTMTHLPPPNTYRYLSLKQWFISLVRMH